MFRTRKFRGAKNEKCRHHIISVRADPTSQARLISKKKRRTKIINPIEEEGKKNREQNQD